MYGEIVWFRRHYDLFVFGAHVFDFVEKYGLVKVFAVYQADFSIDLSNQVVNSLVKLTEFGVTRGIIDSELTAMSNDV